MKRACLGWAAALLLFAGPSSADEATADALFERGRKLVTGGRYAEACPILAESVKIEPGIGAMLWLGECYEKVGQLASAWREFNVAAASAARSHDDREKVAQRRAAAIEPRLPRLSLTVQGTPGVEIRRDGVIVPPNAFVAAEPVDAGLHTVSANAPGYVAWSMSVSVPAQAGAITVNVPRLEVAPVTPIAPEPTPVIAVIPLPPKTIEPSRSAGWKIGALGLGALGVGALGVGAFSGLRARSTYDSSNQNGHCVSNTCDPRGLDLRHSAASLATLSTVSFVGAGSALAASVLLFVLSPSTTIAPAFGPAEAGLSFRYSNL